jgi:5-methylcytosine-specific restriction endonuclease McrBC regulatory subunit McrC
MTTWKIEDSQTTELVGFDLSWLPSQAFAYITPHVHRGSFGANKLSIEAGPYIGTIPLVNGETLYLVPRAGRQSFSRMLLLSEGLSESVRDEFDELVHLGYDTDQELPWTLLLARPYLMHLRIIEKSSLMPDRVTKRESKANARGRIYPMPTLRGLALREEKPVYCGFRAKTYVTPENRVLATAVAALVRLHAVDPTYHDLAQRWLQLVSEHWISEEELRGVMAGLQSKRYTGSRSYYIPALVMARLILAQGGIDLDDRRTTESEPILIDIPNLYERYLRSVIGDYLSPKGYVVEKRTGNRALQLFTDGTCDLEPDIVISSNVGIQLVADAKYKFDSSVPSADYYQMAAYMDRFACPKGLLIMPNRSDSTFRMTSHHLYSGKRVYELRVPLTDWRTTEATLATRVAEVLAE